ncbi:MAG: hypothetical protein JJE50_02370 [Actinomycetales bacterium]|nr:hypothetical protein [Actinomycetales bacterium]
MRRLPAALLGAAVTTGTSAVLQESPPGGAARWNRTNYRGRTVSLLGGVSTALGATVAAVATGGRSAAAAAIVTVTGGVLGALDDLDLEAPAAKGFRGHLTALSRGEITSGAVKLLGIGAASVLAAAVGTGLGMRSEPGRAASTRALDVLASGALIAGTANLVNLFDLRPGRGLKVVGLVAAPLAVSGGPGAPLAAGALGVVGASWHEDLAEQTMLGDTGANALGALVGTALALHPHARGRHVALAVVVALTAVSEKVSFSRVIASTPGLREADTWGRLG